MSVEIPATHFRMCGNSCESTHAKEFGVGRVFLAGDAAHQFSPFGGRGLNSGIGDARAVAAHLARAIKARTAIYSLPAYNTERQSAAIANLNATGRVLRVEAEEAAPMVRRT